MLLFYVTKALKFTYQFGFRSFKLRFFKVLYSGFSSEVVTAQINRRGSLLRYCKCVWVRFFSSVKSQWKATWDFDTVTAKEILVIQRGSRSWMALKRGQKFWWWWNRLSFLSLWQLVTQISWAWSEIFCVPGKLDHA